MPITAESRHADTVFGTRSREHVFSDDSQETLKDSSTSTNSKTRSINDVSPGVDVNPPPKRRLRKPRGKVKVNYQEPSELNVNELDRRHVGNDARRPLHCYDNSPVFRITPDADPPPPKQTRQTKPRNLDLTKITIRAEKNTNQVPRQRQLRSSYNFSDFDDYSLLVSEGSGRAGLGSENSSTPFDKSKMDNVVDDVNDDDINDDDVFDRLEASHVTNYGSTSARVQNLGTSTPQRVQNLGTSTPQRVQNLETSTPQRVQNLETSTPQRVPNLETGLEALSLSLIAGSPEYSTDDVTPAKSARQTRNTCSRNVITHNTTNNNSSLFHVSLGSIPESDHEHSDDLFESPGTSPRRLRTRARSHDNVSVASRLESVCEDVENEDGTDSGDERDDDVSGDDVVLGNDANSSDKENGPSNKNNMRNEISMSNKSNMSNKRVMINASRGETEIGPLPRGLFQTSHSTPLRNERQASYVHVGSHHVGSPRKSRLSQLDQFNKSLMILTPVKFPGTSHVVSPRSKLLHQCDQPEFVPFYTCFTRSQFSGCKKIGEGVFGEVFSILSVDKQPLAVKIIPIEGDQLVNDEPQKTFEEILPEIVISRELSSLRDCEVNWTDNFVHLHRTTCVRGRYPDKLLDEWNKYNDGKGSENDSPEMFDENQLFIILEFTNGGEDLETYQFSNVNQALSVVHQVSLALAAAERELMFEHRDLHLGNILVSKTKQKTISYVVDTENISIPSHGVKICIIDFTLSRLTKDDCTVYLDLGRDETLFQGQGDPQFEVYRKMRENNGDFWEMFEPITNVYWISFVAEKLTKYKFTKKSPKLLRELRHFHRNLSDYNSAYSVVTNELQ